MNNLALRKASTSDFKLNQPTTGPVYDEKGTLLLRPGYVITMPNLIDRLITRGCYIGVELDAEGAPTGQTATGQRETRQADEFTISARRAIQAPVFFRVADLVTSVRRIHKLLCEPASPKVDVRSYIADRAQTLIALVDQDADAVIASTYLTPEAGDYRPGHQLLGAAVVALMAPMCGFPAATRLVLTCAALTRDVGLHTFDEAWGSHTRELPEGAKSIVRNHVLQSVNILKTHGIDDPEWLRFILEHHERPVGTGYPLGKTAPELHPASLLLNLADSYASMVLESERSPGKFPANALKELFLEKGVRYDEQHVALLFKILSRFPPGTLVSLASGEIGLVKAPASSIHSPQVLTIYDRSGMPRSAPIARDTGLPEFAITGCVPPRKCKSASLVIRRLWQNPE